MSKKFPHHRQPDAMDCGPTCIKMIAEYYGRYYNLPTLREKSYLNKEGVSLLGISEAAEAIGFHTLSAQIAYEQLCEDMPLPCIAHWNQSHFVVVYRIAGNKIHVADPASPDLLVYEKSAFLSCWQPKGLNKGIAMALEPRPEFYQYPEDEKPQGLGISFFWQYLRPYKSLVIQLFLGLLLGSGLQLVFPFLTQSLVDVGIQTQNISFVYVVLLAQLMLFFSRTGAEFLRAWLLLHLSTRLNIALITEFLTRLMSLPIAFFESKMTGDILQRIQDNQRVQDFLSVSSLSVLFSAVNMVIFSLILGFYSIPVVSVFVLGSCLYAGWVWLFLKKRRKLDYQNFQIASSQQSNLIELVQGMQAIKLHNATKKKRWEWEHIQARFFRLRIKTTILEQYQQGGGLFINELKNIFITFLTIQAVIQGQMTLGVMLSIQYILGQLNSPLVELIRFAQEWQDAQISLERLQEIQKQAPEENPQLMTSAQVRLPALSVQNMSFHYAGENSPKILDNLTLTIPEGKITAIVGSSGSGKTTLLKLLLQFYKPVKGDIYWGNTPLSQVSPQYWRSMCGVVMQEGFIFSDTILGNVVLSDENPDMERFYDALEMANISEFVMSLPLTYQTKIGKEGVGLSGGQSQRILLARAIYKNPQYLFFDEATSSLDARNEQEITRKLNQFFQGKTVVIVAHRLSTVKNADQIIVLEGGTIVETGTHATLSSSKGNYYDLVKNQIEM